MFETFRNPIPAFPSRARLKASPHGGAFLMHKIVCASTQTSRETQNSGPLSGLRLSRGKKDDEMKTRFRDALRGENERKREIGRYPSISEAIRDEK